MLAPPRRKNQAPFHRDFMGVSKLYHPLPPLEAGEGSAGRDTALLPQEGVPPGECHAVEKKKKKLFPAAGKHSRQDHVGLGRSVGPRGKKRSLGVLKAEGKGRGIWGAAPGPAPPLPAGSDPSPPQCPPGHGSRLPGGGSRPGR